MSVLDRFRKYAEDRFALTQGAPLPSPPREKVGFLDSLVKNAPRSLILEHKRASPSYGPFEGLPTLEEVIRAYEKQNAAGLSILTEEKEFLGSFDDLHRASSLTSLPLLRKDFLVHPKEVEMASAYGADAILIIVAMLSDVEIGELLRAAENSGLDALVEIHSQEELDRALKFPIQLLGVNNRDLKTLKTNTQNYVELLKSVPDEIYSVAESGYDSLEDIAELPERTTAVLAGTSFLLNLCSTK